MDSDSNKVKCKGSGNGEAVSCHSNYMEILGVKPGPGAIDMTLDKSGKIVREMVSKGLVPPNLYIDTLTISHGMTVKVYYKGTLVDGTIFDEKGDKGEPFSFTIGEGTVIEGWDKGLIGLGKGDVCKLYCHPDVAYKNMAQGIIPPNSTLVFEIKVADCKPTDMTKKKTGDLLKYTLEKGSQLYLTAIVGSEVDVVFRGRYRQRCVQTGPNITAEDCFPEYIHEQEKTFYVGTGSENDVPLCIEKALLKMTAGETVVLLARVGGKYGVPPKERSWRNMDPDDYIEYRITLKSIRNRMEPWQMSGFQKLEAARRYKEIGNRLFTSGDNRAAYKYYKLIVDHLKTEALLTGEEEEERKSLLLAGYLNLAIAALKTERYVVAIRQCDDALEMDKQNPKAYYRRGLGKLAINDPEGAKLDFIACLQLNPTNEMAKMKLAACEKKIHENAATEKAMYTKMFSGLSENV